MNILTQYRLTLLLVAASLFAPLMAAAEGLRFGLVVKSLDDVNFQMALQGCEAEARLSGDTCEIVGGAGQTMPRLQRAAIEAAVTSGRFDALAVSVTKSDYISQALRNVNIPVIAFDSPFAQGDKPASSVYVGIDNVEFGRQLGRLVRELHPAPATLCIFTEDNAPNLQERVQGLRDELRGGRSIGLSQRLGALDGWLEMPRCPWDTSEIPKRSLEQLEVTMARLMPDVIVSVGDWPLKNVLAYREVMTRILAAPGLHKPVIIMGTGMMQPEYWQLLNDKLVDGLVSIDFYRMGRLVAQVLHHASVPGGAKLQDIWMSATPLTQISCEIAPESCRAEMAPSP